MRRVLEAAGFSAESGPAQESLTRIARQAGWVGAFDLIGVLLRYGLILLIARLLGPFGLGVYALAMVFAHGATAVAAMGLDQAMLRFIPYHLARREPGEVKGVIIFSTLSVGTLGLAVGLALFLAAPAIESWWDQPRLANAVRLIALATPLIALGQAWQGTLRGFQNVRLAKFLSQIVLPVATIAGMLVFLLVRPGDRMGAVAGATFAYSLVGIISLVAVAGKISAVKATPVYRPGTWMKFALPMSLDGGLLFFILWTDHMMIGWLLRTVDVGIYMSAVRIAAFVAFPLLAINAIFGPMIAKLDTQGDRKTLQMLYARSAWWSAFLGLSIAAVLWLTGRWILAIFGPAFVAGHVALVILVAGQATNSCTGSSGLVLGMTGRAGWRLANAALAATLNVGLNLLLIPLWGLAGAATASAISLAVLNVVQLMEVRWFVGLWAYDWQGIVFNSRRPEPAGSRRSNGDSET